MCLCQSKEVVIFSLTNFMLILKKNTTQNKVLPLLLPLFFLLIPFFPFLFLSNPHPLATQKNRGNFHVTDNHSRCLKILNVHINTSLAFLLELSIPHVAILPSCIKVIKRCHRQVLLNQHCQHKEDPIMLEVWASYARSHHHAIIEKMYVGEFGVFRESEKESEREEI
ncbi:hypothetical protein JHK84_049859 [Glycine max]|uniref:Uncharacterized protein n=2 Tax=Glycine subgen. Soja TaxID=1462606 RepID=K7MR98_SOYBN|nr:hypothetical protein JHK85_050570 [Glycine max]KAG5094271.1 hypothetical protein JHK84_049859 [Glycine max]KAH1154067.1 hypothetical protein GYH30_049623 [Glycine max]